MKPTATTVHYPDEALSDLRRRLSHVRWPDEAPAAGWNHGTDLSYLRELTAYWRDHYDWREREARLNRLHHYHVAIGPLPLHFIHEPGAGPNPVPLLLLHGWTGSVAEFQQLIPRLTQQGFTVIVPSLPGYGLSFKPGQPRYSVAQMADILNKLMTEVLGYTRYGVHGGDWGAHIAARLGHSHPAQVLGIHVTLLMLTRSPEPDDDEKRYFEALKAWSRDEGGYVAVQGTRPQTLAFGLTDSPVGLAAWIVDKLRAWSDCGGDLERRFDKDTVLDLVMLYWLSGAINSSFWPYYTLYHGDKTVPRGARVEVPTGYAQFPAGSIPAPRALAEKIYAIRRWTVLSCGGHFPALEEPDMLAQDIQEFFRTL